MQKSVHIFLEKLLTVISGLIYKCLYKAKTYNIS